MAFGKRVPKLTSFTATHPRRGLTSFPVLLLPKPISSSSGQHFPTGGPGEAVGAVNACYGWEASTLLYGWEASTLLYTHVSARHAPFWLHLWDRYLSFRLFRDLDDIIDSCCGA